MLVGSAIAAATLLQYAVQNLLASDAALLVSLFLGVGGIIYLIFRPAGERFFEDPLPYPTSVPAKKLLLPVCIVALMSVCFGLGDGLVTGLHARGMIDLTSSSRLLYAAGALAAGAASDIKGRRFLPVCTLCLLVLTSALMLFITDANVGLCNIYVCVMYVFSGFYVMYLTAVFISAAPMTGRPELWAGMGRVVRGVFIGLTASLSDALYASVGRQGIAIAGICLSLAVLILFVVDGELDIRPAARAPQRDRMRCFIAEYKLTPREAEVLSELIGGDDTNKDIAARLYLSVRVTERYISSIYEKTGTRTRVGLIRLYYDR